MAGLPAAAAPVAPNAVSDAAAAFGARQEVIGLSLSPDGKSLAYVAPIKGQGSALLTLSIAKGASPKVALYADGRPERITGCHWVANDRLICTIYGIFPHPEFKPFVRLVAVNADGSNLRLLNKPETLYRQGQELFGSQVIDWLPEEDGVVLMSRVNVRQDNLENRFGSSKSGLSVDRLDTRTLVAKVVQPPLETAESYISDEHGTVRIMAQYDFQGATFANTGLTKYFYHAKGSDKWQPLCTYDYLRHAGFYPVAVDRDQDLAYGFKRQGGRDALYTLSLDGSARETLVYGRDDVDVSSVIEIGRRHRVVGASYVTDYRHAKYTDAAIDGLVNALAKALPGKSLHVADASFDESRLLVSARSDTDPGTYYLFDRNTHELGTLLEVRPRLAGIALAQVRPVTFAAADGTTIPGYLTLPPGTTELKGLPAIVMPHGGPSARDEWGFNWLVQFFAAQGFAVVQPNYRGSSGYGDAWFEDRGFKSWEVAIGDVLDAGRWLVAQGADPGRLAIVGWSYGGYAALQSVVVDPALFKAAIAIAPVTDLASLPEQYRHWSNFYVERDFIGQGPHMHEGSPAENAGRIKVPVLLFHGTQDLNVWIEQSQIMDRALRAAGVKHELVTFEGLDHQLDDTEARIAMLRKSDAFLRAAFAGKGT